MLLFTALRLVHRAYLECRSRSVELGGIHLAAQDLGGSEEVTFKLSERALLDVPITSIIRLVMSNSEHIVETFDAGVDPQTGTPFIVMELLQGEELAVTLKRQGRLLPQEVITLSWTRRVTCEHS